MAILFVDFLAKVVTGQGNRASQWFRAFDALAIMIRSKRDQLITAGKPRNEPSAPSREKIIFAVRALPKSKKSAGTGGLTIRDALRKLQRTRRGYPVPVAMPARGGPFRATKGESKPC
jgi:hypothetical protein